MGIDDKLCFVQFLHPGKEPKRKFLARNNGDDHKKKILDWNKGDKHERKFLVSPGRCVRNDEVVNTDLVFWGEWEPESEVIAHIEPPLAQGPQYLYRPYYVVPNSDKDYKGLQNTDPFVFDTFLYGNCLQHEFGSTKQMRHLERGSVILFGSCVDKKEFGLDTVFVVSGYIDYDGASYKKLDRDSRVPRGYKEITLNPLFLSGRGEENNEGCSSDKNKSYRLYFGATYDKPVGGMFSFFPCLPRESCNKGFARPIIKDLHTDHLCFYISDRKNTGINFNQRTFTLEQMHNLWQSVVKQVLKQSLCLGISAQFPECRP